MVSPVQWRLMTADETPKLQLLLNRCYEDSYADAHYYDNQLLSAAIENHKQYSMVAINSQGDFVAHLALRNFHSGLTADSSMAIVDPDYRTQGLLVKAGAAMNDLFLQLNLSGLYMHAVTVHPYTQRSSLKGGSTVTGIYLNFTPAFTRFLDIEQPIGKPTPVVILIQPLNHFPQREIIWPTRYKEQLQNIFKHSQMVRRQGTARPTEACSVIRKDFKTLQKICTFWVDTVGNDLDIQLTQLMSEIDAGDFNVCYLQLPLDQCQLDDSITAARKLGFFYAGALPEYGQRDWLSLQRLDQSKLDTGDIHLGNEHCHQLLKFILEDQ